MMEGEEGRMGYAKRVKDREQMQTPGVVSIINRSRA
jgi:hypothetical protein